MKKLPFLLVAFGLCLALLTLGVLAGNEAQSALSGQAGPSSQTSRDAKAATASDASPSPTPSATPTPKPATATDAVVSPSPSIVPVTDRDEFTVTYNANGGSGVPTAQTKRRSEALQLSETLPTRTDYTFLGWATSPVADKPEYMPGDWYTENEDVTLYAIWEWSPPDTHVPGDINGDGKVNAKDVVRLIKYFTAPRETIVDEAALDVNGDGKINAKDTVRLKKYLAGADVEIF